MTMPDSPIGLLVERLYGRKRNPFYIYTPHFKLSSAGIRALHFLCNYLNSIGESAYVVLYEGKFRKAPRVSGFLKTPILTEEEARSHRENGLNPIVIYPETIPGNPLNAAFVVRFLLNYAGSLGGSPSFPKEEFIVAYSKNIALHYSKSNNAPVPPVLFLPTIDPREIAASTSKRSGVDVVYAAKYRSLIGEPPKISGSPTVEIFRDGPRMQSREQVLRLISEANIVYSFENSSITTEAVLAGKPAVFVPNPFLGEIIAEHELGWGGIARNLSPEEITRARDTVASGQKQYMDAIGQFERSMGNLIEEWQKLSSTTGNGRALDLRCVESGSAIQRRLRRARQICRDQGWQGLLRFSCHYVMKKGGWTRL